MQTLSKLVFEKANENISSYALSIYDKHVTYSELIERALIYATALRNAGADSEPIGIVGQRKDASYVAILAILFAGCHYVPISPKSNTKKILTTIEDTQIRFLAGAVDDLYVVENILIENEREHNIAAYVPCEIHISTKKKWIDSESKVISNPLIEPAAADASDLCYILFTSGSTGQPKGVQVAHRNVYSCLNSLAKLWKLSPGFKASQFYDFSFDPSVFDLFNTWCNGGELCVLPESELLLPQDFINREKLQIWSSVPSVATFMSKMGLLEKNAFPDLIISQFCGEPLPKALAHSWQLAAPNSSVENHYGPTEATIYVCSHAYSLDQSNRTFANDIVPIGKSFQSMTIKIIDQFDRLVQDNSVGEIVFSGSQISKGYLNDKQKTAQSFVKFDWDSEGAIWYRSGDFGFYNDNGELECIGRKDNQIKIAGKRIELAEIESCLAKYKPLIDVVVVPIKDENMIVKSLVAFTLSELSEAQQSFIQNDILATLDNVFFPKKFVTLKEFPYSPSGKLDRNALKKLAKENFS